MLAKKRTKIIHEILQVRALAASGRGVARGQDGKVYFIGGAVVGDQVRCVITRESARYAFCDVVEILHKSSEREITPVCEAFAECGGCEWMDVPYQKQLLWKKHMFQQSLAKHISLDTVQSWPCEVVASPQLYKYRSRLQLRFRFDQTGKLLLGFFAAGSHRFVAVRRCEVAAEYIAEFLTYLRAFPEKKIKNVRGILEIQELLNERSYVSHKDSDVVYPLWVRVKYYTPNSVDIHPMLQWIAQRVLWAGTADDVTSETWLWDRDFDRDYLGSIGGFYQSHRALNTQLRAIITERANTLQVMTAYDLFCGGGNFSLALIALNREVIGVDENADAIRRANLSYKRYRQLHKQQKASYLHKRCIDDVRMRRKRQERFDLVLINPPRMGARDIVDDVSAVAQNHIFYISCNPLSMAVDVHLFLSRGFSVVEYKIFDFCPHTHHFESWIHLQKAPSMSIF